MRAVIELIKKLDGNKTQTMQIERELIGGGMSLGDIECIVFSKEVDGRMVEIVSVDVKAFGEWMPNGLEELYDLRENGVDMWNEKMLDAREELRQGNAYRISA